MALAEYAKALPRILVYEGGKVDDPHDPGGRTNKGITQNTYNTFRRRQNLPVKDVYLISDAEVSAIYKAMYWDRIMGDRLPAGVAFCVFDAAVNSGVGQAAKWLQRALGSSYSGIVDGDFGAKTLEAVMADSDNDKLIARFCALRLAMLKGLKTWARYGKGWGARVANVLKIGQAWASGSVGPQPVDVSVAGGNRKANPNDLKQPLISATLTNSTTGVGAVGSGATSIAEQLEPMKDVSKVVLYGFLGLTVLGIAATAYVAWAKGRRDKAESGENAHDVDKSLDEEFVPVAVNDNTDATLLGQAGTG